MMNPNAIKNSEKEVNTQVLNDVQQSTANIMMQRSLTNAECEYVTTRDKWYSIRKIFEKLIYLLPSIITALATALRG